MYLKELSELDGVSRRRRVASRKFIEEKDQKNKVDSLKVGVLGNLIAFKEGDRSNRKFVLAYGRVGFMVTNARG